MKMIDVLNMMAEGEIKEGTKLVIGGNVYSYIDTYTDDSGCSFVNEEGYSDTFLEDEEKITQPFLNKKVELIEPKPKKYLVKLNVKWLKSTFSHVNYVNRSTVQYVIIGDDENLGRSDFGCYQTQFTKKELQSIKPVKEFLDDMQGKYELVEVTEDNEID